MYKKSKTKNKSDNRITLSACNFDQGNTVIVILN